MSDRLRVAEAILLDWFSKFMSPIVDVWAFEFACEEFFRTVLNGENLPENYVELEEF